MTFVNIKTKLSGLFPDESWLNKKGHLSALVKGGKIICYRDCNLSGRSVFTNKLGRSCHSEMNVIKTLKIRNKRQISKYIIWNIRWNKCGKIVDSKPCLNCKEVLLKIGIKTIIYSTNDGLFIKNKVQNIDSKLSSGFIY